MVYSVFFDGDDLFMTVTSIEVETVGRGTVLAPQGAVFDTLGLRAPHPTTPGQNAQHLARVISVHNRSHPKLVAVCWPNKDYYPHM